MAHLGALGKPRDNEPITFDYFDDTPITVADTLTDLDYLDFMDENAEVPANSPQGRRFVKDLGRLCIAPDDFDRFWALAKKNRQTTADVFDTLMSAVEAATARPTGQPSDSSGGQQATGTKSAVVSSSLMERLAGRPDLQLFVVQAAEARAAG